MLNKRLGYLVRVGYQVGSLGCLLMCDEVLRQVGSVKYGTKSREGGANESS